MNTSSGPSSASPSTSCQLSRTSSRVLKNTKIPNDGFSYILVEQTAESHFRHIQPLLLRCLPNGSGRGFNPPSITRGATHERNFTRGHRCSRYGTLAPLLPRPARIGGHVRSNAADWQYANAVRQTGNGQAPSRQLALRQRSRTWLPGFIRAARRDTWRSNQA